MPESDNQKRIDELKEQIRDLKVKQSSCSTNTKIEFMILELEDELFELRAAGKKETQA